jgi:uncharacterized protein YecT (DUF1311 family)
MKPIFIVMIGLLIYVPVSSQSTVAITPDLEKKIHQDIEKQIPALKKKLETANANPAMIEFSIDTFKVERFMYESLKLDYSDLGMRTITYKTAKLYDSLVNKYYNKLSAALKSSDRNTLTQTQRSWLAFRDNEKKLMRLISKDEYSGGGTLQQLFELSDYLTLVKDRLITIYRHYSRATQN